MIEVLQQDKFARRNEPEMVEKMVSRKTPVVALMSRLGQPAGRPSEFVVQLRLWHSQASELDSPLIQFLAKRVTSTRFRSNPKALLEATYDPRSRESR